MFNLRERGKPLSFPQVKPITTTTMKAMKFTQEDYIKANRIGSRLAELENQSGFKSMHKVHRSKKSYNRKDKKWKREF
jgi:hypothetical protein